MTEDGFPKYRTRDDGQFVKKGGVNLHNGYVVPHNLWLSTKFNAHINVEICSSVAAVKYLFKYVYKGHDKAKAVLHPAVARHRGNDVHPDDKNEVHDYLDARYVSTCEALWRIFKFKMHGRSPAIKRLAVHLEDHQQVRYGEGADLQQALEDAKDTPLMGWFKLNDQGPEARQYTYPEIPKLYFGGKSVEKEEIQQAHHHPHVLCASKRPGALLSPSVAYQGQGRNKLRGH